MKLYLKIIYKRVKNMKVFIYSYIFITNILIDTHMFVLYFKRKITYIF